MVRQETNYIQIKVIDVAEPVFLEEKNQYILQVSAQKPYKEGFRYFP